jgi:hypothetical protein
MVLIAKPRLRQMFWHHGSSSQCQDITESVLRLCSCCVEQSPGSQAFVDHLLVDHVDLVNRDLPSWVHAHIYATHLLDFLGEKRHHKVSDLNRVYSFRSLCLRLCPFAACQQTSGDPAWCQLTTHLAEQPLYGACTVLLAFMRVCREEVLPEHY